MGDQVFRYSGGVEYDGVRVDKGYPRHIDAVFRELLVEFGNGVEAAFADPDGVVQLFKDGWTVSLRGRANTGGRPARWGVQGPGLPSGMVDAALADLDGYTYLFSGDQYLRSMAAVAGGLWTGSRRSRAAGPYVQNLARFVRFLQELFRIWTDRFPIYLAPQNPSPIKTTFDIASLI